MLPILYSFRRCPYAIRARMALRYSGIQVALREVILADKPNEMLLSSPKGTVPVLILDDGTVIDESRDIMSWAICQNDPDCWAGGNGENWQQAQPLIEINDNAFKQSLDRYKYADRFPEYPASHYRQQAEDFIQQLESRLSGQPFLLGQNISVADIAIFPFIRQFAFVDKNWFDQSEYTAVQMWLKGLLELALFTDIMVKEAQWKPGDELQLF